MTAGPLNRVTGALGMLALLPTALLSATGNLTAGDTATRAGVTLVAVIAVRKVVGWYISVTASSFERQRGDDEATDGETEAERLARRRSDFDTIAS